MNGLYQGVQMRAADSTPIEQEDVVSIQWVEGGETVGPSSTEYEHYYFLEYSTKYNMLEGNGPRSLSAPTVFGTPFSKAADLGDHTYIVTLADGEEFTFVQSVVSDTVMPVVAAKSNVTDLVCAEKKKKKCTPKKRRKKIKARFEETEVDNLTARPIVADDGSIRLLIQWAAPDRAMELVSNGNVRLRIYVGNGWNYTPTDRQVYFLWADAPLHAGSVVIPADAYRWINDILVERGEQLVVAGMYREQFQGYHNRGYIDGIRPDLEPLPSLSPESN